MYIVAVRVFLWVWGLLGGEGLSLFGGVGEFVYLCVVFRLLYINFGKIGRPLLVKVAAF